MPESSQELERQASAALGAGQYRRACWLLLRASALDLDPARVSVLLSEAASIHALVQVLNIDAEKE